MKRIELPIFLKRSFRVDLTPDKYLTYLEKQVNKEHKDQFQPLPFFRSFRFRLIERSEHKFELKPGPFSKLTSVYGCVKEENNHSIVYLRMDPYVWFMIIFVWSFPLFFFLYCLIGWMDIIGLIFMLCFWLGFGNVIILLHIGIIISILDKVEKVSKSYPLDK